MNMPCYLEQGLVIEKYGELYEFSRNNGNLYQFESVQSGEIISFTESKFFTEWREQTLTVVPTKSSQNELALDSKSLQEYTHENEITDLYELVDEEVIEDALRLEQYIKNLRSNKISRGQVYLIEDEIPRIAKKLDDKNPPATSTLIKWWRKYEKNNDSIRSLIDKRSLTENRQRITDKHEEFIQNIIDEDYMKLEPKHVSDIYNAYENTIKDFNLTQQLQGELPVTPISERTFYRKIESLDKYEVAVAQLGKAEAKRQFRMIKGHLPADYPLEYVEIDHTPLDIFIIDDKLLIPLGRPWLTIIKDRYSGVLIGLFISFVATGTDSIFGALKHSLQPHDKAHQIWPDIENEMPWGLAQVYVTDRGKDFMSTRYKLAIKQLLADYEYCAVRNPWLKGSVERAFLTLNFLLETLPGKTFPRLDMRKDYDPLKHAVVRFSSFTYILYKWACDIYNVSPNRRKGATPIDLWNDGLVSTPRAIPIIPDALDTLFGKPHSSTLRQDGITCDHLTYANSRRLEEIFEHVGHGTIISYRINTSDLGYLMVMDPRDKTFFKVPCLKQDYAAGLTLIQHQHIKKHIRLNISKKNISEYLYRAKQQIAGQIDEELDANKNKAKTQLARYAGINLDTVLAGEPATLLSTLPKNDTPRIITPEEHYGTEQIEIIQPDIEIPDFGWTVS